MHKDMHRDNNFNLLRLIFALLVILSHSPEMIDGNRDREILTKIFHTLSFGELAVDAFFLLSGYLIVQSWTKSRGLIDFVLSRLLRIYPGFIAATLVCTFLVAPFATISSTYFSEISLPTLATGALLLMPPQIPAVFYGTHNPGINGAMWTISYEFTCYLVTAIFGLVGLFKYRSLFLFFVIIAFIIFGLQRYGLLENVIGHYQWKHPLVRLGCFFLMGAIFYLFRDKIIFRKTFAFGAAIILFLGMFSVALSEIFFAFAGAYCIFYFAFQKIKLISNFNKLPDVSYGVYLYGWPTQKMLLWYVPGMSPWTLVILASAIAIGCGLISWYIIEKPFLALKNHGALWPSLDFINRIK